MMFAECWHRRRIHACSITDHPYDPMIRLLMFSTSYSTNTTEYADGLPRTSARKEPLDSTPHIKSSFVGDAGRLSYYSVGYCIVVTVQIRDSSYHA